LFVSGPELAIATIPRALNCSVWKGGSDKVSVSLAKRIRRQPSSPYEDSLRMYRRKHRTHLQRPPNLVRKRPPPDALSSLPCSRRVPCLDHEALDIPVISTKVSISLLENTTRKGKRQRGRTGGKGSCRIARSRRGPESSVGEDGRVQHLLKCISEEERAELTSAAFGTASQNTSICRCVSVR
jgi:hypothetical protein